MRQHHTETNITLTLSDYQRWSQSAECSAPDLSGSLIAHQLLKLDTTETLYIIAGKKIIEDQQEVYSTEPSTAQHK